ncbi:hypothetical protein MBLNU459_g3553t1 [Dothideomycetes sp. NU459]
MSSRLIACSLGVLSVLHTITAAPIQKRSEFGPVITTDFPDPSLIKEGDTWYAFGTQSVYDYTNIHIQVATSSDFSSWSLSVGTDALPTLPSWVDASNPLVWAPDVNKLDDGTFIMYFSATTNTAGDGALHCVGTATSASITGPYTPDEAPFVCPTAQGGAIDASGFREADGTRYVAYKIDGNALGHGGVCNNGVAPIASTPLMLQRVAAADGTTKLGDAVQLLTNDEAAGDGPDVEAPVLLHAADGTHVLFYSSGCYSTTGYTVSYATSTAGIAGPYARAAAPLFETGSDGLAGPGGADVALTGEYMVFHALADGAGPRRFMYAAEITVSGTTVSA